MIQLYKGDCLIESDNIESGSVDLILTDLPYGTVKGLGGDIEKYKRLSNSYWDNVIDTNEVYNIANRILRKNGKMVLFCQEPFTTELVTKAIPNVPFCYRMIWEKDHYANALLSKKAPVNYYEDILVFSKNYDFEGLHPLRPYFTKVIDFVGLRKKTIIEKIGQRADHVLRVKSSQFDLCTESTYLELVDVFGIDNMKGYKDYEELKVIDNEFKKQYASTFNLWEGKKYKSNILKYKKDYDGYHPTQKPVLLLEDLIKTFSNKGDLVVDLTMGSGSTGVACANTKRSFIGIEQDDKYFAIAQDRIDNAQRQSLIDFPTQ
jgi:site-specific DNA-methyltransferase (adenine-specific)